MIVVKASLKTQWIKEIEKFSHLKATEIKTESDITMKIKDKIKRRNDKIKKLDNKQAINLVLSEISLLEEEAKSCFTEQFNGYDLFVLNYETLRDAAVRKELLKRKIQFVFADEVHYVKSRTAKRSEALYEFGTAKMKIGATATPVGKDPEDLFGIFKFVAPEVFPSFSNFARMYIKYAGFGKVAGVKNKDHLLKKYGPNIIVKTKEEISSQLPSLVVIQRHCEMTEDQTMMNFNIMSELDDLKMKERAIRALITSEAEIKNNKELMLIGAQILALQTFAQELVDAPEILANSKSKMAIKFVPDDLSSPKLDLLVELVDEIISSGEKVCIFSKYKTVQSIITQAIHKDISKNVKIAYVNGTQDGKERYVEVYDKFRDQEDYKVLIMTDAGAEGLNLSKCKYVIEFDLADSYGIQTQRHGRIERSDSIHENVFVYQLIASGSWDEISVKIIEKKEAYDSELIKALACQS